MSFFRAATDADGTRVELKDELNPHITKRERLIANSLGLEPWEEYDMIDKLQQVLVYLGSHVKNPQAGITKDTLRNAFLGSAAHLTETKHKPGVDRDACEGTIELHETIAEDLDSLLNILVNSGDVIEITSGDILL